jgi:GntR family transcriptional repressor for pyruvate dehydrogenase complex
MKLPAEAELMKRFQVSRISVREALRSLEAVGLLEIKHGSGAFVAEIDSKPMTESLFSILRINNTTISELSEARIILEPSIARLAVEQITAEELDNLQQNVSETSRLLKEGYTPLASSLNIEFHSLIAEATHNTVITLTMKTLFDVLKQMTLDITDDKDKRMNISNRAINAHRQILGAMKQKNPQQVYELMLNHIQRVQNGFNSIKAQSDH